jgi:hypothetical protein
MPTSHARSRRPIRTRITVAVAVLFTGLLGGGGAALAEPVAHGHNEVAAARSSSDSSSSQDSHRHDDRQQQDDDQNDPPNPNCTLIVPPAPLTAAGLGTPYRLKATDRDGGRCHEANPEQSAFVEATILNPATGTLSTYHPLVIDDGTSPAAPVVPLVLETCWCCRSPTPTSVMITWWSSCWGCAAAAELAPGPPRPGRPGSTVRTPARG